MLNLILDQYSKVFNECLLDTTSPLGFYVENANKKAQLAYLILENFIENTNKGMKYLQEDVHVILDKSEVEWQVYLTKNSDQDRVYRLLLPNQDKAYLYLYEPRYGKIKEFKEGIVNHIHSMVTNSSRLKNKGPLIEKMLHHGILKVDDITQMLKDLNLETIDYLSDEDETRVDEWIISREQFLIFIETEIRKLFAKYEKKSFRTLTFFNSPDSVYTLTDENEQYCKDLYYKEDNITVNISMKLRRQEYKCNYFNRDFVPFFSLEADDFSSSYIREEHSNFFKYVKKIPLALRISMPLAPNAIKKDITIKKHVIVEDLIVPHIPIVDVFYYIMSHNKFSFFKTILHINMEPYYGVEEDYFDDDEDYFDDEDDFDDDED